MNDSRIGIRLSEKEKNELSLIAQKNGMTISEFMKYKIFNSDSDRIDSKYIYETPSKDRHQYISTGILNDIYWMLYYMNLEEKGAENMIDFKALYRDKAKKSMSDSGYLRIERDE